MSDFSLDYSNVRVLGQSIASDHTVSHKRCLIGDPGYVVDISGLRSDYPCDMGSMTKASGGANL
jgi:hypothetical protein